MTTEDMGPELDERAEAELREARTRHITDLRGALRFAAEHTDLLGELRATVHPERWAEIVGLAAAIQSTVQVAREAEPCQKLFALNGTKSACRPRPDGHCCWCERVV